jgi:hypothetical protein
LTIFESPLDQFPLHNSADVTLRMSQYIPHRC